MGYILLVEDDKHITDFVKQGLQEAGHTVEHTNNADAVEGFVETLDINLIIMDIMLQGNQDGINVVKKLRQQGHSIPIIFLSARNRVEDKVSGFNVGGDDYLSKPFSFIELKARVDSLLRRSSNSTSREYKYQYYDLVLDLLSKTVTREGKTIELQRREFMLLEYFMENPEQILGKSMLLERVWGFDFDPQTNVVDVLISRLRSKIDKNFTTSMIHTVRGMGYVLKV